MARRLVLGNADFRISRPGFDAATANVADRSQISFALSRDVMGRVASAGDVTALNSLVAFAEVFSDPPPVIFGVVRSGYVMIDDYNRQVGGSGRYQDGTPYCAAVTNAGILVTNPMDFAYGLPAGDKFIYLAVA